MPILLLEIYNDNLQVAILWPHLAILKHPKSLANRHKSTKMSEELVRCNVGRRILCLCLSFVKVNGLDYKLSLRSHGCIIYSVYLCVWLLKKNFLNKATKHTNSDE